MSFWESRFLMTVADLAIVSVALVASWALRAGGKRLDLKRVRGPRWIAVGLLLLAGFFVVDLVRLWIVPSVLGAEATGPALSGLHLEWSRPLMLAVALALAAGLVVTLRDAAAAQESLEAGVSLYEGIVAIQSEFIVRWLPDGTRTFVNDAYCEHFEQPREALLGTSFMPLIADEDRDKVRRKIAGLSPEAPSATAEHQVILPDGSIGWHEWTDHGFFDDEGRLVELQSVGRDVTAFKAASEALRRSEAKYRAVFDASVDGLVIRRLRDGKLVDLNPAMAELHGWSRDELLRMPMEEYVPAESLRRFEGDLEAVRRGERRDTEGQAIHRDGHVFDLEGFFVPFVHGDEPHVLGVLRDITERKQAEAALRASEEKFHRAFNASPDAISITSAADGRLLDVNEGWVRATGLEREEVIGRTLHGLGLWPLDEAPQEVVAQLESEPGTVHRESRMRLAAGDDRVVDLRFATFVAGREARLLTLMRDVTERWQAEARLRERLSFERLVAELSSRFVHLPPSEVDNTIEGTLAAIARLQQHDRASLMQRNEAGVFRLTHSWAREGARRLPVEFEPGVLSWTLARLAAGERIELATVADLPPEAEAERRFMEAEGVASAVVLPLQVAGRVVGSLAVGALETPRPLAAEQVQELEVLAGILANALAAQQGDRVLRESEQRYRNIFESSALGFTIRRLSDLRLLTVNPAMAGMFGYSVEEFLRLRPHDYFEVDEGGPTLEAMREVVARGETFTFSRIKGVHRDGHAVYVSGSFAPFPFGGEPHILGSVFDETARHQVAVERQRAFEEIARLKEELELERDYLREEVTLAGRFGEIIGDSPAIRQVLARVDAVAQTDANVLIQGESGVGKELVARAIHAASGRSTGPLVRVNCPSIPRELFESEFFGHVKGSFTGAHRDRVGRFELAHGGTLFLDEVSEIPPELQAKLLRVLQEGEYQRVGEEVTREVDVRIIAASNRGLKVEIMAERFREDLYYRLSVFPIEVPPLRERPEDILPLAQHFVRRVCRQLNRRELPISQFQADQLLQHHWPGNVRELQNVIEQAVILSPGERLRLDRVLSGAQTPTTPAPPKAPSEEAGFETAAEFKERERLNLVAALEHADWKVAGEGGAAELLGLKPSTLAYQMKALGIERPR